MSNSELVEQSVESAERINSLREFEQNEPDGSIISGAEPIPRKRGQRGPGKPKVYEISVEQLIDAVPLNKLAELQRQAAPREKKPRSQAQIDNTNKLVELMKERNLQKQKEYEESLKNKVKIQSIKGKHNEPAATKVKKLNEKVDKMVDEQTKIVGLTEKLVSKMPEPPTLKISQTLSGQNIMSRIRERLNIR